MVCESSLERSRGRVTVTPDLGREGEGSQSGMGAGRIANSDPNIRSTGHDSHHNTVSQLAMCTSADCIGSKIGVCLLALKFPGHDTVMARGKLSWL